MRLPRPLRPYRACALNSLLRGRAVLSAYGAFKMPKAISATARGAATIAGARPAAPGTAARAAAPKDAAASSSIEPALLFHYKTARSPTVCGSFRSDDVTSDAASSADDGRARPFSFAHAQRNASGTDQVTFNGDAALPSVSASTVTTSTVTLSQLERHWSFPAKPPHIPAAVWKGMLRGLHLTADNPIGITAHLVNSFFRREAGEPLFSPFYPTPQQRPAPCEQSAVHQNEQERDESRLRRAAQQQHEAEPFVYLDSLSPLVSVRENFDSLLIDAAHCSRSTSDTYYLDPTFSLSHAELAALAVKEQDNSITRSGSVRNSGSSDTISSDNIGSDRKVLRTHGTAHQAGLLGCGIRRAIWSGAVARRDQVDPTHYPVFHQIDGIRIFDPTGTNGSLEVLTQQHASLLETLDLTREMKQLQQQQLQAREVPGELRDALDKACAAAGLSEASAAALCSFSCIDAANPHRDNPIVLQLQITLERLLRFLWSYKPRVLSTDSATSPESSLSRCNSTNGGTKHSSSSVSKELNGAANDPCLRWVYDEHFPFTSPSLELEVLHEGKWLEVLGAGEIRAEIIHNACSEQQQQIYHELLKYLPSGRSCKPLLPSARGWAFGMGIERVAMLLFSIDDIRLLWSEDPRFTQQFSDGRVSVFTPFSYMPPVFKDISFWLPSETQGKDGTDHATDALPTTGAQKTTSAQTHGSEREGGNGKQCPACPPTFDLARFYEVCREEGGALVESVTLRDAFTHPTTGRKSLCFRFTYKALDRTLTHTEVNEIQDKLIAKLKETFVIELR